MSFTAAQMKELAEFATGCDVEQIEADHPGDFMFSVIDSKQVNLDPQDRMAVEISVVDPGIIAAFPDDTAIAVSWAGSTAFMYDKAEKLLSNEFNFKVNIFVSDEKTFMEALHISAMEELKEDDLQQYLLVDPSGFKEKLFKTFSVNQITYSDDQLEFTVSGEVSNKKELTRNARDAYEQCWFQADWCPSGIEEAVSELFIASNDSTPSASDMGFEFTKLPGQLFRIENDMESDSFDM